MKSYDFNTHFKKDKLDIFFLMRTFTSSLDLIAGFLSVL